MSSSKSKSANASTTTTTTETNNLNFQNAEGNAVAVGTGNVINTLDGGAINSAFDFGTRALDLNSDIVGEVLTAGSRATQNAMQMVFDSAQPQQAGNKNLTQTAMVAAAVIGATVLIFRGLK